MGTKKLDVAVKEESEYCEEMADLSIYDNLELYPENELEVVPCLS